MGQNKKKEYGSMRKITPVRVFFNVLNVVSLAFAIFVACHHAYGAEDKKQIDGLPKNVPAPTLKVTYVATDVLPGVTVFTRTGKVGPETITFDGSDSDYSAGDEIELTLTVTKRGKPGAKEVVHGPACKCHICQQNRDDAAAIDELFDAASKIKEQKDVKSLAVPMKKLLGVE